MTKIRERPHVFMAGLNQKVFLNQWGEPETQVSLNKLGELNKLGTMFLISDPIEGANISVWIYKKRKSILLFTKEKLVSHFSLKELRRALERE